MAGTVVGGTESGSLRPGGGFLATKTEVRLDLSPAIPSSAFAPHLQTQNLGRMHLKLHKALSVTNRKPEAEGQCPSSSMCTWLTIGIYLTFLEICYIDDYLMMKQGYVVSSTWP